MYFMRTIMDYQTSAKVLIYRKSANANDRKHIYGVKRHRQHGRCCGAKTVACTTDVHSPHCKVEQNISCHSE